VGKESIAIGGGGVAVAAQDIVKNALKNNVIIFIKLSFCFFVFLTFQINWSRTYNDLPWFIS
jgi:hypothetical protein